MAEESRTLVVRSNAPRAEARLRLTADRSYSNAFATTAGDQKVALLEDRRYWFDLRGVSSGVSASVVADGSVVRSSPDSTDRGYIDTGSQAGSLELRVRFEKGLESSVSAVAVEVLPVKFDESSFRRMVDDIANHLLELALQLSSAVSVGLRTGLPSADAGIQQRFFFLRHLLARDEFRQALHRVARFPYRRVESIESRGPLLTGGRIGRSALRAIASERNRMPVPPEHPLAHLGSLATSGVRVRARDTLDTPENRFVKFILEAFGTELSAVASATASHEASAMRLISEEASDLHQLIVRVLESEVFREVGASSVLPLGSPVMQRRGGYREILEAWLRFQVAAEVSWQADEKIFLAGKKDTDRLYEYWLFFQLLEMLDTHLGVPVPGLKAFLRSSSQGLSLGLRGGRSFVHEAQLGLQVGRNLRLRFSYNRTFSVAEPDKEGSWSFPMRPDYTLTFWPSDLAIETAERLGLCVHVHFDAKYRLEAPASTFETDYAALDSEKAFQRRGRFRRGDLLVAHTYRDAIRRSAAAYILFPGEPSGAVTRQFHHEVLPGVGALPVRPAPHGGETGIGQVGKLVVNVVEHLSNRTSARERASYALWRAYGNVRPDAATPHLIDYPETLGGQRLAPPDETRVLIIGPQPGLPDWVASRRELPVHLSGGELGIRNPGGALDVDSVLLVGEDASLALYWVDRRHAGLRTTSDPSALPDGSCTAGDAIFGIFPLSSPAAAVAQARSDATSAALADAAATGPAVVTFDELLLLASVDWASPAVPSSAPS